MSDSIIAPGDDAPGATRAESVAQGPAQASAASWYVLIILSAINMFAYVDRSAIALMVEPIKADLHLSDGQFGLLSGLAFAIFYAIMGMPLAFIADRSSRVKLLAACLALWSVMTMATGMARNFTQIFLMRMGVGVGEAGCLPAGHSLIGDMFPRRQRSLAVSIFQCGAVVGTSLGLFIIGLIGQSLGWRAALVWAGAAGLPLALLAWFTMREPPRPQETKPPYDVIVSTLAALLKRPAFVHLTLAYSIGTICTNGLTQWMPAFLMRSYGMTMAEVGAWSGLASAIGGILGLLTGGLAAAWLSKHDPRWELRIPLFAYATYIPIFVLMALSSSAWMALVLKTLAFYVAAIGGGVALSSVQSFAEPNRRATAVSIVLFLSSLLGLGLGPYLVGLVSDLLTPALGRESLRYALLASVVIVIWAVVHFQLALQRSTEDRVN